MYTSHEHEHEHTHKHAHVEALTSGSCVDEPMTDAHLWLLRRRADDDVVVGLCVVPVRRHLDPVAVSPVERRLQPISVRHASSLTVFHRAALYLKHREPRIYT